MWLVMYGFFLRLIGWLPDSRLTEFVAGWHYGWLLLALSYNYIAGWLVRNVVGCAAARLCNQLVLWVYGHYGRAG